MYESLESEESHRCIVSHKIPDDRTLVKQWNLSEIREI